MKRRCAAAAPPALPPPLPILNPPPPDAAYFHLADDGIIFRADAGAPLPREALYWCLSASSPIWATIVRGETPEPAPPFILDAALTDADLATHELFASRNLNFAWLPLSAPSPITLPHPDEPGAPFYRLKLPFLGWVRGVAGKAYRAGKTLPPDTQRAVDRVWSYVCNRAKIDDGCRERLPPPGDWAELFPESA